MVLLCLWYLKINWRFKVSIFVRAVVVSKSESASPAADYINNLILSNDMSGGSTLTEIKECVRFTELEIEACSPDIREDLSIEYICRVG